MKNIRKWILRKKSLIISAGIMLTAIPVITLSFFMHSITTKALETKIMEENRLIALMCAKGLDGRLRRDMAYAAKPYLLSEIRRSDIKGLEMQLNNLISYAGGIETAFITSSKGILLASYPLTSEKRRKNFSDSDWYKAVSKNRQPHVSEFHMRTTEPAGYLFTTAVPLIEPGAKSILGILVMRQGENYIRNMLTDMGLACSQVYIFDKQGNLIYHPKYAVDRVINCSHIRCIQKAASGDKGVEKTLDPLTKEPVLAAYYPVSGRGWSVLVTRDESEVLAPVKRITLWIIIFTSLMLFSGIFFAVKGAELLNSTQELTLSLNEGQYAQRVYDEFLSLLDREWTDTSALCAASTEKLKEHIGVEAGIFYVYENNRLEPYSTFGIESPAFVSALSYACLRRKKIIRVKGISTETSLNLKTEGKNIRPADIIAIPLMYQDQAMGVLELGSIAGFKKSSIKSLEQIAPQLAAGINTIKVSLAQKALSRKILDLDEELQSVHKELKAKNKRIEEQQKELKEINAKLQESLQTKTGFHINMHNEMRKPLNSIIGLAGKKKERLAVVIVEDPKAIRIVETALLSEGYKVLKTASGKAGLEIAETKNPDLIVMDLMMPELDGFEAIDILRSAEKTSDTPIIALTSMALSSENRKKLEGKVKNITEKTKLTRSGFIEEIKRALNE